MTNKNKTEQEKIKKKLNELNIEYRKKWGIASHIDNTWWETYGDKAFNLGFLAGQSSNKKERICDICGEGKQEWLICNDCKEEFAEEKEKAKVQEIKEIIENRIKFYEVHDKFGFNSCGNIKVRKIILSLLKELEEIK